MSKKKINQRAIREISKNIKKDQVYKVNADKSTGESKSLNSVVDQDALFDLKRVILLITIMLVGLTIFSFIVFKTEMLASLFNKFQIKY